MIWQRFSEGGTARLALAWLAALCLLAAAPQVLAGAPPFSGTQYCSVPPYAGSGVKPNLLLMLDNSSSMYDLAYTDTSAYCIDDSFEPTASYPGYFDENTVYGYSTASGGKFVVSTTPLPAGCNTANLGYLCVSMNSAANRTVTNFLASGKFLNWLSMSKLDIEKLALTGGKFQLDSAGSSSGVSVGESRGCEGKHFVKIAKEATNITFGIRGPVPADTDYLYRSSFGGNTRIEIYDKHYNKDACMSAASDWQNAASSSTFTNDMLSCLCDMQEKVNPLNQLISPSKGKLYVDIMSYCYRKPAGVVGEVSWLNTLVTDCQQRTHVKYSDNLNKVPVGGGEDICATNIDHALTVHSNGQTDSKGYVGGCITMSGQDQTCVENEAEDYCRDVGNPLVMDPPAGPDASLPNFIFDAGIYSLGTVAGSYRVRVSSSTQPTGLIQEFANEINFGAMIFNSNGAAAECRSVAPSTGALLNGEIPCIKHCVRGGVDTGTECELDANCDTANNSYCQPVATADGGKIISAVGTAPGDHRTTPSPGVIAAIDQVTADAWTPLAESLYNAIGYFANRSDLRLQTGDFSAGSPALYSCQRNNVLLVTDGTSTADRRSEVNSLVAGAVRDFTNDPVTPMPAGMTTTGTEPQPPYQGSYNLDDLAWLARNRNITDFSKPAQYPRDYISTHVVYTGVPCGAYNSDGSCKTNPDKNEAVPEMMMQLTAAKGGGRIANARNYAGLEKAFRDMLQSIASGSGSDTSIVATGDGNGAIYLQEQFYPSRSFDGGLSSASWIGEMQSLWYYIDPFLGTDGSGSTIREESDGDFTLNLKHDKKVEFRQDAGDAHPYAYVAADSNGDGVAEEGETRLELDQVKSLWRAGQQLWARNLVSSPRSIYTPMLSGATEVAGTGLALLDPGAAAPFAPYLNLSGGSLTAAKLINYLQGFDYPDDPGMRGRAVTVPAVTGVTPAPADTGVGVWKLGDIISSTPQVESSVPLGSYQLPAPSGYGDSSYRDFVGSAQYKGRGMVYVGANDGMLHAFNLGSLDSSASGEIKARLTGTDLGKEQWAFVPNNALPYLKYLAEPNYRHLYYVDGGLSLVDASIGVTSGVGCSKDNYWSCVRNPQSWRTVLIGGMGLGGASCDTGGSCVPTPLADPANSRNRIGYSSYFALDVTDPLKPALLWEFSNPALGYSTSGPAIVRIKSPGDDDNRLDGRWFAVFGSGPTGPVDTGTHQFKGESRQELQLFVVDLRTGALVTTIHTGIANAFAGAMTGAAIDVGRFQNRYQDDALYLGYTSANTGTITGDTTWSDGGVLRVLTKENPDPGQWTVSQLISGIGPVTAPVAKLQDRKNHALWLYFGTGRYFFGQDDMQTRRALYGVKEPCYNVTRDGAIVEYDKMDTLCSASVASAALSDQTSLHDFPSDLPGWQIQLERPAGRSGAERLVAKPVSSTSGAVYFTTFQPSSDPCLFGGSYLWGVSYDNAGALGNIQGKALVSLASGGMQETGLNGKLGANGGRRSATPMNGRPGGVKLVSNSGLRPLKKIIHIQER